MKMKPGWFISRIRCILLVSAVLLALAGCGLSQEQTPTMYQDVTPTVIPETARDKALNYVSSTLEIPKESLIVYEHNSLVLDQILKEEANYFAIGDKQSVVAKLVVDSTGKVMDVHDYGKASGERYKSIAGNINPGLYNYLQSKELDDIVKVKIFTSDNSEVVTFIESRSFKITNIGDLPGGRIVYAELPKSLILELAKRVDVADMEQDLPSLPP
jgi:hypothetical protein